MIVIIYENIFVILKTKVLIFFFTISNVSKKF
jgi:hypothetical protein